MKSSSIHPRTLRMAQCGLLCAVALIASALEQLIPALPMMPPGAKPGISNIAVLTATELLGPCATLAVIAVKALFALMTRGAMAFLMSLAGGLLSGGVMLLLLRLGCFGTVGIGIAGAAAHNLAQVGVASLLLTAGFRSYLPVVLLFGLFTGSLTGLLYGLLRPGLLRIRRRWC